MTTVILVLAVLLVTTVFLRAGPGQPTVVPATDTNKATRAARAPPPTAGQALPPRSIAGNAAAFQPRLDTIKSLSELNVLSLRDARHRGQALAELYEAVSYCETAVFQMNHPSISDRKRMQAPEGKQRFEFFLGFAKRFCDAPALTTDEIAGRLIDLGPEDLVVQGLGLSSLDEAEAATVGVAIAERLGSQSHTPAALERASEFLLAHGKTLPAASSVPAPAPLRNPEDLVRAQRLAVQMVSCRVRGGCEAGGMNTALWCTDCIQGDSLEQHWRRQYSPLMIDYARAIAGAINW